MPRFDGTGPFGTFRNCMPGDGQGNPLPYGRGFFGKPFGAGRGRRFRYFATGVPGWAAFGQPFGQEAQPSAEEAKNTEIRMLEQQLEAMKKRVDELKKQ